MNDLPTDLADPLHLLDPSRYRETLIALGAAALVALIWILWRRLRRRPAPAPSPVTPPPPTAAAVTGIAQAIADIRARYADTLNFRQGCHELSQSLRSHFETVGRQPLSTLTAREIAAAIGDTAVSSVFELVAELQFRRREPSSGEFEGICDMAVTVSRGETP